MANRKSNRQGKRKQPKIKEKQEGLHPLAYEIIGLTLIAVAAIEFFEFGIVGRIMHSVAMFFFGNLHFFVPLILLLCAFMLMVRRKGVAFKRRVVYGVLLVGASLSIFSHHMLFENLYAANMLLSDSVLRETWRLLIGTDGITLRSNTLGGGMIGALLFSMLHVLFDSAGTKVAAFVLFISGIILITGKAFVPAMAEKLPAFKNKFLSKKTAIPATGVKKKRAKREQPHPEEAAEEERIRIVEAHEEEPFISKFTDVQLQEEMFEQLQNVEKESNEIEVDHFVQEESHATYRLPAISLLQPPTNHDQSGEYSLIQTNAKKLEQTFASFGVKARVTQVHLGPAVTKYEVLPDIGVKVSKIVSLQDDLALALAAKDIRIEAPIPGKSAIGIEVPNSEIAVVTLREVLEAKENNAPDEKLLVGLGRDVAGQSILAKLNKMPHLLVAGSTGSGKSVCINGIIISILMRAKPSEVRLMMIDPKMVELSVYNGIPHLLAPVVTDARKAAQALQKVVAEMERRYDLFSYTGTRNIEGYNEHMSVEGMQKLPYIVVIVDELADLMMVASNEVEEAITRLAQMARAAGIHLILATQRPSVDVITGIIKANIPSRIAFAVSSAVDSRTILDMGGAEKLLGRGDMLYLPAGASKPTRVQGAFVSDQEVECVILNVIRQQQAQYEEAMIPNDEVVPHYSEELDDLYEEAVKIVVELQTASVSLLQRKLRIGYARAARIIDQLEAHGIVSSPDGSRARQVLRDKH